MDQSFFPEVIQSSMNRYTTFTGLPEPLYERVRYVQFGLCVHWVSTGLDQHLASAFSESCQVSKMVSIATIVNSFSQNTPYEMFDRFLNTLLTNITYYAIFFWYVWYLFLFQFCEMRWLTNWNGRKKVKWSFTKWK